MHYSTLIFQLLLYRDKKLSDHIDETISVHLFLYIFQGEIIASMVKRTIAENCLLCPIDSIENTLVAVDANISIQVNKTNL